MRDFLSKIPGATEADMVDQIRRDRRYRSLGWGGVLSGIVLFVIARAFSAPHAADKSFLESLPEVLPVVLASASLLLIAWVRVWIRESNEPFRYTFSIGEFECVPPTMAAGEAAEGNPMAWLTRDLTEKLSERVQRLSLLEVGRVPEVKEGDPPASHVHISGWYGFRYDRHWELEVVPKVRLGGEGAPAKLAKTVRFKLRDPIAGEGAGGVPGDQMAGAEPPRIQPQDYRMMFERVYWSVASQIYAQIRNGVAEKVMLLPRGRLRAAAYIREADDYAASNTLDAYAAARKLYHRAREFYDLASRPEAAGRWRRQMGELLVGMDRLRHSFRRGRSWVWRRSGRPEVMTARAELGYARMLIAEWHLKLICGMVPNEMYAAGKIVQEAVDRLRRLPPDVAGQPEALFRAHVTQATARLFLRDFPGAHESLATAEELRPAGARENADFLFAAGLAEPDRLRALRLLGRAVELDPMMERAHYLHAVEYEAIWRSRKTLEPDVAEAIDAEYEEVIALNPGNLSAWANRGYMGWLLADEKAVQGAETWRRRAIDALEAGRQYKEVRREATVGELDWNLTRLAAEAGRFTDAYGHYVNAVSATLTTPQLEFEEHFYESANPALVQRYEHYVENVRLKAREATAQHSTEPRLIKSVMAFVLNDCGLLYQSHYERSGNDDDLERAERAFEEARQENPNFVLPAYNLATLWLNIAELPGSVSHGGPRALMEKAIGLLENALRREPDWPQARLKLVSARSRLWEELQLEIAAVAPQDGSLSRALGPGATMTDSAAAAERRAVELGSRCEQLNRDIEADLNWLLPHSGFTASQPGDRLHLSGIHVEELVNDRSIQWTRDFDMLHVAALIAWAGILAENAPSAADPACEKLRGEYYRADFGLLDTHLRVAQRLAADFDGDESGRLSIVGECQTLLDSVVRAVLKEDPVHLGALQWTQMLEPRKRRSAIEAALDGEPSSTTRTWLMEQLVELGEQLVELGDRAAAIDSYDRAARGPGPSAATARLRMAVQLEAGERPDEALAAFRAVRSDAADPQHVAEAAAGVARILAVQGRTAEAEQVYEEAVSDPATAVALANWLALQEESIGATVKIYEDLLARGDISGEVRSQSHIALAFLQEESDPQGSREHLRTAAEAAATPAKWDAAIYLARALQSVAPSEAEALYERTIAGGDDDAVLVAVRDLATMLKAGGDDDAARIVLGEAAAAHPAIAADLMS